MYVLIFFKLLSETFLILRRIERGVIKNLYWPYPLFSYRQILMKFEFSGHIFETHKYQISWKSIQLKPSFCMRVDAQTDRHDEANSRFLQFC
jgi:hypothetical protein